MFYFSENFFIIRARNDRTFSITHEYRCLFNNAKPCLKQIVNLSFRSFFFSFFFLLIVSAFICIINILCKGPVQIYDNHAIKSLG